MYKDSHSACLRERNLFIACNTKLTNALKYASQNITILFTFIYSAAAAAAAAVLRLLFVHLICCVVSAPAEVSHMRKASKKYSH
jgi:hypothetical protein